MATQPPAQAPEPGWFQRIVEMLEGGQGGPAAQVPPQAAAPPGPQATPMPGQVPPNPNDPMALAQGFAQRNEEMAPYGQTGPGAPSPSGGGAATPEQQGMIAQLLARMFGGGAG